MRIDRSELHEFIKRWEGKGQENEHTQQFWLQLLRVIGFEYCDDVLFEKRVSNGGQIDVWIREADTLIEQKSLNIDLDRPELRQGVMKTPFKQALDYAEDIRLSEQPRFIVTCNFGIFRIYDRSKYGRSELESNPFEFTLLELEQHPEYLGFITNPENSRLEKEKDVSMRAGALIGQLYDKLQSGYLDPTSDSARHALNVLCVRLVFCLYCEDADLFEKDSFLNYLKDVAPEDVRYKLKNLFHALDTPVADRDPYDTGIRVFPYVNGGLFKDEIEIPNFSQNTLDFLLNDLSAGIDWSQISPTIFGGIFESTLNPDTRRTGGMHYTTPENIHRVIDPLFLDDLKGEFNEILNNKDLSVRQKRNRFTNFHKKLCDLKFFDPACGSGNFLTETYLSLRKLENRVLYELESGQIKIGSIEDERIGKRISLNQFYGIEINDFAVSVAETALWISRLKANGEASMFYENGGNDFPLDERATIIHGNALSEGDIITDWEDILPASQCSYIMGNPPFIGQDGKNEPQRREMELIWGEGASGYLDYVTAWYKKAADYYGDEPNGKFAFVSTNSICQGTPVTALFKPLFISGWRISFAWPSFVWKNEAANMANVHVVIVGMDKQRGPAKLFAADGPRIVDNINPYLAAAPTFFVEQRTAPLSEALKPAIYGSKPADGGFLQIKTEEAYKEAMDDPIASKYVRRSLGATELINGKQRWCLWLEDASPQEIEASSFLSSHVHSCYEWRSQQKITGDAYKLKDTPHLFRPNDKRPRGKYLCMPQHKS